MSRRARRWFDSESKPLSAATLKRRLGTRRHASYSTGAKWGQSDPTPVAVAIDRTKWQRPATPTVSLGSRLRARERSRAPRVAPARSDRCFARGPARALLSARRFLASRRRRW